MRVYMERQSISRRDDKSAPNGRRIEIIDNCRLRNFIDILIDSYCPKVNSDSATWILWDNHKVISVFDSVSKKWVCFQDAESYIKDIVRSKDNPEMYLYYRGKENIKEVIEEFKEELIV